jgi:hypothetical protein
MTYTYKLARRLAISRNLAMLHVLVLVAACAGDTTAPEAPATPHTPAAPSVPLGLRVLPNTATIEIHQPIRFRGEFRTSRGQVSTPQLSWEASGGHIDSLGNFVARVPGKYHIVGRGPGRGRDYPERPDTSVVIVVPQQPTLVGVRITPRMPRLVRGERRSFAAIGRLRNGTTAPIGVTWKATGGTIDAGGVFQAGSKSGMYRIIATNTRGNLADTVLVRIVMPTMPDTLGRPGPTPGPTPTLVKLVLKPASVTLATRATHQFAAFGRTGAGDSVAVAVTFHATGGTITPTGLYTAGATPGTFRIVATAHDLADTSIVTLARSSGGETPTPVPPPGPTPIPGDGKGTPMGIFGLLTFNVEPRQYTLSVEGYTNKNVIPRIAEAKRKNIRLLLTLTGGSHKKYMTNDVFDMAKWRAYMDTYNDPAIKAAIAAAVADGTIIGNSVMDEPANVSGYVPGVVNEKKNYWGPPGTMKKVMVDDMCRYVKDMFPTLPVGVLHDHRIFEPEKGYQHCEFLVSQYRGSKGNVNSFRDGGLAWTRRYNMSIIFSLNVIQGGDPGKTCLKLGDDPHGNLCPMSADQLRDWGITLGSAGCALIMWRYYPQYIEKPEIQRSLTDVAAALARVPRKSCGRPSA